MCPPWARAHTQVRPCRIEAFLTFMSASWYQTKEQSNYEYLSFYSGCQKFFPIANFQIPLNPPFSKGDFLRDFVKFTPLKKGG
jgi:hypothetical protein